mgnify:FL=1
MQTVLHCNPIKNIRMWGKGKGEYRMGGGYSQFCRCSSQRSQVTIYITAGELICVTQRLMKNVLKDCERPKPLAQNIIKTFFSSLRKEKKCQYYGISKVHNLGSWFNSSPISKSSGAAVFLVRCIILRILANFI